MEIQEKITFIGAFILALFISMIFSIGETTAVSLVYFLQITILIEGIALIVLMADRYVNKLYKKEDDNKRKEIF